jgi:hypothetical protein
MNRLGELAPEQQQEVVRYFRLHEKRDPDESAIFVCDRCCMVYDDFSGEKKSMSGDDRSICKVCGAPSVWYLGDAVRTGRLPEFVEANPELVEGIECLRCERGGIGTSAACVFCDTAVKVTGCRRCQTLYAWRQPESSKYRFLVPLTDKPILQRCVDRSMGGV